MISQLSTKNSFYNFKIIDHSSNFMKGKTKYNDLVVSYFVLEGELRIKFKKENVIILKDQTIILPSLENINNIEISEGSKIFEISSIKNIPNIIEIVDDNGLRSENIITDYKIIKNPKKVNKPWGHEIWFVWLKDYHVLKKIFMKKGNKCSLQYHEEKYETNYLIKGKAKIIKNFHIDLKEEKSKIIETILAVDLNQNYSTVSDAPYVFTNVPGEVHRVYSEEDYVAYEVSTPQLDDVVRVQDENKRPSGLVISEHK